MAIRYHFDLYPRDDPRDGARVVRFTKLQTAEYRGEANGTGSGRFSIRADDAEAQLIDPRGLQYVRVVREDTVAVTEAVVGGFFLDSGDFTALDEQGTRLLTFGGAGTLSYLARAIMASHTYISPIFTGQDPFDDTWRLYAQSTVYANGNFLGAMLWRVIYEAQHNVPGTHRHADGVNVTDVHDDDRPAIAIADLVMDFDQFVDSNGADWTLSSGEFKAQVGENVLAVVQRLMQAGLYVEMDPDTFELRAYQAATHRRTRTGTTWGANVIYFTRPTGDDISTGNIKSDAKRAIAAFIKRSWVLAGGSDVYGDATGTTDIPWEGFHYADVNDATAAAGIAGVQVGARDDAGDTLRLRGKLESDPANGKYLPFEDALLDDLVTVKTGTGQFDHDDQNFPIAAITIALRQGGDWDVWYDLGSSYSAASSRQFQVTPVPAHNHLPNPALCEATVPGTPDTELYHLHWTNGVQETVDIYPSGTGDWPDSAGAMRSDAGSDGESGYVAFTLSDTGDGSPLLPATAAETYRFDFDTRYGGGIDIRWLNSGATISQIRISTHTEGNVWIARSATLVAPANTNNMQVVTVGAGHYDHFRITIPSDDQPQNPLNGISNRAKRCDSSEHEISDRAPNADDDADAGYPRRTIWHVEGGATYISTDDTDGAAVWELITSGDEETVPELSTTGSASDITNDSSHNGFPGAVIMPNGNGLLVYRKGTDHASTLDGSVRAKIGVVGADGTIAWGSESTIVANPGGSLDVRFGTGVSVIGERIWIAYETWDGNNTLAGRKTYVIYSDDNATSWSSAVQITGHGFTTVVVPAAPVVLAPDNDTLLLPIYGSDTGSAPFTAKVIRTTDDFATQNVTTIATGTIGDGTNWTEPVITPLDNGELLCSIREDTDQDIYSARCLDVDGSAWTTAVLDHDGYGLPTTFQAYSGALIRMYRQITTDDAVFRVSYDRGATWGDETDLESTGTYMAYATAVQVGTTLHAIYSLQASNSNADIVTRPLTDIEDVRFNVGRSGSADGGTDDHGALDGLADDDHTQYLNTARHAAIDHDALVPFFTVDPGTPTYDDTTTPGIVEVSVTSQWGIDSGGDPYFNSAGVTSGEEAALMRDSETGAYFLRPYTF